MQATAFLAEKAQISTENMERMTDEMHTIAKKTKVETVNMRIITIVTMLFLPGTFISVSTQFVEVIAILTASSRHS
jgi:Mg2+ and Co2+ transporter CorA